MRAVTSFAVAVMLCITATNSLAAQPTCKSYPIAENVGWVMSATWLPRQQAIFAADIANQKILMFNTDGRQLPLPSSISELNFGSERPLRLIIMDSKMVLSLSGNGAVILSSDLSPGSLFDTSKYRGNSSKLAAVYEWIGLNGDTIFGYGAVEGTSTSIQKNPGLDYQPRFFFANVDDGVHLATRVTPFEKVDKGERNQLHLLGLHTMTSFNSKPYYLSLRGQPDVRTANQNSGAERRVAGMPSGFENLPELRTEGRADTSKDIYAEIERQKMVAGIFSDSSGVYVLTRQLDNARGGILWLLHPLNVANGTYSDALRLPTIAPHIVLAEGTDSWYILEKGSVESWGKQALTGFTRIPRAWIADHDGDSPLSNLMQAPIESCN